MGSHALVQGEGVPFVSRLDSFPGVYNMCLLFTNLDLSLKVIEYKVDPVLTSEGSGYDTNCRTQEEGRITGRPEGHFSLFALYTQSLCKAECDINRVS